ncbi:MAG: hypothetical protein Q8O97_03310, partial [bacterium]|nr:hypothetical protein [bacterium]
QTPPTVSQPQKPVLLEVVLRPVGGGSVSFVSRQEGARYSLGHVSSEDAQVELPEGYRFPQRIDIRDIQGSKDFQLLVGPGELPVSPERVIRIPLSEEIRVPITEDGLTQVLFEGQIPCKE